MSIDLIRSGPRTGSTTTRAVVRVSGAWTAGLARGAHRAAALLAAFCLIAPAMAIEEPPHEVVRTLSNRIELRRYAPYVVAEVDLATDAQDAGSQAFPILAGYIFGKNKGERRMAMTAPVTQTATPVKLAMTAPVTQRAAAGQVRVQFVLPADVTLATAPEPLDPRVRIREEPAATWAVLRYSGTWSKSRFDEHLAELRAALVQAGVASEGEPLWARYDGPLTPWFLRRNEIWLSVR